MRASHAPDAPFPGAHSQVPGQRGEAQARARTANGTLPLEATPLATTGGGWGLRLPCRAEEIHARKKVVVYQEVLLRRNTQHDHVDVETRIKREELDVTASGQVS